MLSWRSQWKISIGNSISSPCGTNKNVPVETNALCNAANLAEPSFASVDMLVPGQTAEGTWPLVKVTNFGLPELQARPEPQPIESNVPEKADAGLVGNDQQFVQPTTDIRSEIHSLGVTLYFLLSGVALSAEALQQGPKFAGFPKPLRSLLGRLLHRDPDQRPKDLLVVTELIRESLGKIERRRALSDRYGIPLRTNVPLPRQARSRRLVAPLAVAGLLLLLAAAIAPMYSRLPACLATHRDLSHKRLSH